MSMLVQVSASMWLDIKSIKRIDIVDQVNVIFFMNKDVHNGDNYIEIRGDTPERAIELVRRIACMTQNKQLPNSSSSDAST